MTGVPKDCSNSFPKDSRVVIREYRKWSIAVFGSHNNKVHIGTVLDKLKNTELVKEPNQRRTSNA